MIYKTGDAVSHAVFNEGLVVGEDPSEAYDLIVDFAGFRVRLNEDALEVYP